LSAISEIEADVNEALVEGVKIKKGNIRELHSNRTTK
jgi:hypothetical protein